MRLEVGSRTLVEVLAGEVIRVGPTGVRALSLADDPSSGRKIRGLMDVFRDRSTQRGVSKVGEHGLPVVLYGGRSRSRSHAIGDVKIVHFGSLYFHPSEKVRLHDDLDATVADVGKAPTHLVGRILCQLRAEYDVVALIADIV